MSNSRFTELLDASPLSPEDKYNLGVIFDALRDERKIDIIDHWPLYLEKIVLIQHLAEEEKKRQVKLAFKKISALIDEAYLRDQELRAKRAEERAEQDANMIAAAEYDRRRDRERII